MTTLQAIGKAKAYSKIRKQVRKQLITAAREAVKNWTLKELRDHFANQNDDVRKLRDYPSDLSEERLIALIEFK